MSDIGASIEEYLVGLATSLQHAQQQLGRLVVPGDEARPTVSYQLPKLDFELRLSLELSRERDDSPAGGRTLVLRGRPADAASSSARSQSASVITGSFVAVPVSGGKPPPVVTTEIRETAQANRFGIEVRVTTPTGEPVPDVPVSFDADSNLAQLLNMHSPVEVTTIPQPEKAVVRTDDDGVATTFVDASNLPADAAVPVVIDVVGKTTTTVLRTREDSDQ